MKENLKVAGYFALGTVWVVICVVWYLKFGSRPAP
jgi:hypothetical protein